MPQAMPAVISRRAPKRPIRRAESGEITTIGAVIGRIIRPLSTAEWPGHVLQVLGLEEHHRPVGADQGEGGGAGAEVGPVAEELEVDDRLTHPVLDPPEGVERGQAGDRHHSCGRAAPGPALDQRQDDRRQPDAERQQARRSRRAARRRDRSTRAPLPP